MTTSAASARSVCTLIASASSGNEIIRRGDCDRRVTPASTFKIAIAVMGFDAGILLDAHHPAMPYRPEYEAWLAEWKTTIDPTAWLDRSVVWYSQCTTRALGMPRFANAVTAFGYGNHDVSGDPGQHNGLTHAWLSSSLRISPSEQISFLRTLLAHRLPAAASAQEHAISIMPGFTAAGGWHVHGKTGSGFADGGQIGWFVGWADLGARRILFARLTSEAESAPRAGLSARAAFLSELPRLIAQATHTG